MAWVDMKDSAGSILRIPETMYRDMYSWNTAYTLVNQKTEKKEQPVATEKVVNKKVGGVEVDEQIQKPKRTQGKD